MRKGTQPDSEPDSALSGEEIAQVLRDMADRAMKNLEDHRSLTIQLEALATRLEKERNA